MGFAFEITCVKSDLPAAVLATIGEVLRKTPKIDTPLVHAHVVETGAWTVLSLEPGDLLCGFGGLLRPRLVEVAAALGCDAFWFKCTEYEPHVFEATARGDYRYAGSSWFGDGDDPPKKVPFRWSPLQAKGHCARRASFELVDVGRTLRASLASESRQPRDHARAVAAYFGFGDELLDSFDACGNEETIELRARKR